MASSKVDRAEVVDALHSAGSAVAESAGVIGESIGGTVSSVIGSVTKHDRRARKQAARAAKTNRRRHRVFGLVGVAGVAGTAVVVVRSRWKKPLETYPSAMAEPPQPPASSEPVNDEPDAPSETARGDHRPAVAPPKAVSKTTTPRTSTKSTRATKATKRAASPQSEGSQPTADG